MPSIIIYGNGNIYFKNKSVELFHVKTKVMKTKTIQYIYVVFVIALITTIILISYKNHTL
jgi:hypothetical protein